MIQLNSKRNYLAGLLAAVLITSGAWATDSAASGKGSMELTQAASVAGAQLASGKYQVEWTTNGDLASVKIFRGGKEVASTTARVIKFDASYDTISLAADEKGAKSLAQISFGKSKIALRLGHGSDAVAERAAK